MKKILILFLTITIISSFGCSKLDITTSEVIKTYEKLGLENKPLDKSFDLLFNSWVEISKPVNWYYNFRYSKHIEDLEEIKKLETWNLKIAALEKRVKYQKEKKDIIYEPWTTYGRKKGDCEDLSKIVYYVLGDNIWIDGEEFKFDGFKALFGDSTHIVTWYKNQYNEIVEFSNFRMSIYSSWEVYVDHRGDKYKYIINLKKNLRYGGSYRSLK
jgi:hypothetical protein